MEVILIDDVAGLGKKGSTVKVANGYARNFLVPRKLAIPTGAGAARLYVELARQKEIANNKAKVVAEQEAGKFRGAAVEASARAGEDGALFGSVTASDIAELLGKQGLEIDRRRIELAEPIKTLGDHVVSIKFHQGVEVPVTVKVVAAQ